MYLRVKSHLLKEGLISIETARHCVDVTDSSCILNCTLGVNQKTLDIAIGRLEPLILFFGRTFENVLSKRKQSLRHNTIFLSHGLAPQGKPSLL